MSDMRFNSFQETYVGAEPRGCGQFEGNCVTELLSDGKRLLWRSV